MLEKFPNNMQNVVEEHPYLILKELQKGQHYEQRDRLSFTAYLIRYALLVSYTKTSQQITSGKVSITIFFFIRENSKRWHRMNYDNKIALEKRSSFSRLCLNGR